MDAAELAGFIEPGKAGWLRRRAGYAPRELKSQVQIQRRAELYETSQLIDLAGQLGASEVELIAGWPLGGKDDAARAFAGMVVASGSAAAVAQLAERLFAAMQGTLGAYEVKTVTFKLALDAEVGLAFVGTTGIEAGIEVEVTRKTTST